MGRRQLLDRRRFLTATADCQRCAIATVNVPPRQRADLENWLWKERKIRICGGEPPRLRLSTPYYLRKRDLDRFLESFDEYRKQKHLA